MLLEKSAEIATEGMKRLSRSGNNTQLWMCLVVITYHSIEDRMVKNLMKSGNIEGDVKTDFYGNREVPFRTMGKPVVPDAAEQTANPRSRSAKLRIAEKV